MSMKKMLAVVAAASLVAVAAPAFAANPFSDVPMNHWAYDAVEQLAAKGILEGYPNGTFKGNRAMTRYEIAQMVARMMNAGVGGADADKLKALIVEFAPELEALGVKVDGFDGRLTKLEQGVGGWKFSGQMRFDFNHHDHGDGSLDRGNTFNRARLFLHKDMENGVTWDMRWHSGRIDRWWVTANDFFGAKGLTLKAGQFTIDWMGDDGFFSGYASTTAKGSGDENDVWVMDHGFRGFDLGMTFRNFYIETFAATDMGNGGIGRGDEASSGSEYYGARLKFNFSKFWLSGNMFVVRPEDGNYGAFNRKFYWVGAGANFSGIGLSGFYMWQKNEDAMDDANGWKVILTADQSLLKFTSLRLEYQKLDEGFYSRPVPATFNTFDPYGRVGGFFQEETKVFLVKARQQWTKKFNTFEGYTEYKYDNGMGKDKEWYVGLGYAYTPNLYFELSYNKMDYGYGGADEDDKAFRFRTILNF